MKHKLMYKAGPMVDFMRKNDEISKMPLLLLLMSQKYGRHSGIFSQIVTQIIHIAVPNEGEGKISIMAKAFANTLAILLGMFGNFVNVPTCSS